MIAAKSDVSEQRVHSVAVVALQLISAGWCRGYLAVDACGRPVFTTSASAERFSIVGALKFAAQRLYGSEWAEVMREARKALAPVCGGDLSEWNDAPNRWKGDVLDVLEGL